MKIIAASVLALAINAVQTSELHTLCGKTSLKICYNDLLLDVEDSHNKHAKACFATSGYKIEKLCLKNKYNSKVKTCVDQFY